MLKALDPQAAVREREMEVLREAIQHKIAELRGRTDIKPASERLDLIAALEGALSSGNFSAALMASALERATSKEIQEAAESVMESIVGYEMATNDPEFRSYSKTSQRYMQKQYAKALQHSPTLQNIEKSFHAVPEEDRKEAQNQQAENWKKLNELREKAKDPNSEYHQYEQQLRVMKNIGIASMPQGEELLKLIEEKRPLGEIQAKLDKAIDHRAELAAPVVKEMLKVEGPSTTYLKEKYGKADGSFDTRKLIEDWSKTSSKERDEAYRAAAEGKKLTEDQQKIVHMSQVMIASDAALPMQAVIAFSQNKEMMAQLTDKTRSVDERAELLEKLMKQQGFKGSNSNTVDYSAEKMIAMLDNNPQAAELLKQGKFQEVGAMYKREFGTDDVRLIYARAQAAAETQTWADEARRAEQEAYRAAWKKIEEEMSKKKEDFRSAELESEKKGMAVAERAVAEAAKKAAESMLNAGVSAGEKLTPTEAAADKSAVITTAKTPEEQAVGSRLG